MGKRDNELVETITREIESGNVSVDTAKALLNAYKDNTYGEWSERHEWYRQIVEKMVNDCGFEEKALAEFMANNHPTLQQNFMRLCTLFIKEMSRKTYYDGRNEKSVLMAQRMAELIETLPFV